MDSIAVPSSVSAAELRQKFDLDPQQWPDQKVLQVFGQITAKQVRTVGIPALWMAMADIDERLDAGLLDHYKATVDRDQKHDHDMQKRDQGALHRAMFIGLGILAVIVVAGIVASALAPAAAVPIMGGVGVVAGVLGLPRLIEALKGVPPPAPKPDEDEATT